MKLKSILASLAFLVFFIFLISSSSTAKHKSSCILCHTDENAMKSLFKAPAPHAGEEEG